MFGIKLSFSKDDFNASVTTAKTIAKLSIETTRQAAKVASATYKQAKLDYDKQQSKLNK